MNITVIYIVYIYINIYSGVGKKKLERNYMRQIIWGTYNVGKYSNTFLVF